MLLGVSGKRDGGDYIGQFGEGLKLGVGTLVKEGHTVLIRTAKKKWMFSFKPSTSYLEEVLQCTVHKLGTLSDRTRSGNSTSSVAGKGSCGPR